MTSMFNSIVSLLVIFTIYRPFISRLDRLKYFIMGSMTVLYPMMLEQPRYTTIDVKPRNNDTYFYSRDTNQHLSTFEDTNIIVMLALSASLVSTCGLFSRWHFPITFVQPATYITDLFRHGLSLAFLYLAISQTPSGHNASITFATIAFLWYIAGPYFIKRWQSITLTLCTSIPLALISGLSFYTCISFSSVIVLTCHALDYLDAILNTYPHLVTNDPLHVQNPLCMHYLYCLARLVSRVSSLELDPLPINDLHTAIEFLGPASRSWKTMAALFPVNLRQDLCLLYAFFRTCDDLIDDAPTVKMGERNLAMIRRFLRDVFSESLDWSQYSLPSEGHVAIFRNFTRIAHYLCPRAMSELTDAWELDLRGDPVKKQKDLLNYAAYISGTFGELCTCVIMYKTGHGNWGPKQSSSRNEDVLLRARATGQCLQLVNIARDIIADSLVGRCYVPLQYMPYPSHRIYHLLKIARTPLEVGENQLKSFSLRILELADQISDKAQKGIEGLPNEVQDSIRAAFEIYMEIGPTLRQDPGFPLRAKVPKRVQQWIAFRCIYGFRGPVARAITTTFDDMVSIYTHLFSGKGTVAH